MIGAWLDLRGNGGYVNLAQVSHIVPVEVTTDQWVPRATLAGVSATVDIDAGTLFSTAAECAEFIRDHVNGWTA